MKHTHTHTFFKPSRSPLSAKAISSETYVSGPGSIPAPFITDRMFWALSMSLHQRQAAVSVLTILRIKSY